MLRLLINWRTKAAATLLIGAAAFWVIWLGWFGPPAARGGVSYTHLAMRHLAAAMTAYRVEFGALAPASGVEGRVYGPVTEDLFSPMAPPPADACVPGGSYLVDPYRRERLFPGEIRRRFWFEAYEMGGSDDGTYLISGYPLRHWRSPAGDRAVLIGNGPDMVADAEGERLSRLLSGCASGDETAALLPLTYDPTNGASSRGDIFRVLR